MHIQRVINSESEYRNTKQIQISNAQMTEEPRGPDKPGSSTSHGECACCCGSNRALELVSPRSCFDHLNLDH